jgi:hypothetical protein
VMGGAGGEAPCFSLWVEIKKSITRICLFNIT